MYWGIKNIESIGGVWWCIDSLKKSRFWWTEHYTVHQRGYCYDSLSLSPLHFISIGYMFPNLFKSQFASIRHIIYFQHLGLIHHRLSMSSFSPIPSINTAFCFIKNGPVLVSQKQNLHEGYNTTQVVTRITLFGWFFPDLEYSSYCLNTATTSTLTSSLSSPRAKI